MSMSLWGSDGSRKYLTDSERKRFLSEALKSKHKTFLLFLFYTGCRVSEALQVRARHFTDEGEGLKSVIIHTLKQRKDGVFRTVPLPDDYYQMIVDEHDLLNLNPGKTMWPRTRQWGWLRAKEVMTAAKIHSLAACPKGLRHTMGTHAVNRDVPLPVIQGVLGHSTPVSTNVYAKVDLATIRRHQLWR